MARSSTYSTHLSITPHAGAYRGDTWRRCFRYCRCSACRMWQAIDELITVGVLVYQADGPDNPDRIEFVSNRRQRRRPALARYPDYVVFRTKNLSVTHDNCSTHQ